MNSATCWRPTPSRRAGSRIPRIRSGSTSRACTSSSSPPTRPSIRPARGWRWPWGRCSPDSRSWAYGSVSRQHARRPVGSCRAGCTPVGPLLGGLLAVLWLAPSYWAQTYWGGAVAACGGALVYGALPRIVRQRQWWAGFHLGLGLAMLMCSRPYEGLVASLPAAVVLLAWSARSGAAR